MVCFCPPLRWISSRCEDLRRGVLRDGIRLDQLRHLQRAGLEAAELVVQRADFRRDLRAGKRQEIAEEQAARTAGTARMQRFQFFAF